MGNVLPYEKASEASYKHFLGSNYAAYSIILLCFSYFCLFQKFSRFIFLVDFLESFFLDFGIFLFFFIRFCDGKSWNRIIVL